MGKPVLEFSLFKALPGYPFYPCKACHAEGHMVEGAACWGDHSVLERAQAMHPGLVLHQPSTDAAPTPAGRRAIQEAERS